MFYNERLLFENCGEKLMQGYNLLLVFKKFKVHEKMQCFGVKRALPLSGQVNYERRREREKKKREKG